MPKPAGRSAFAQSTFSMADRAADGIERRKQAGNKRRRVIAQVKVPDAPDHETGITKELQHRILGIIDYMTRNIEPIPPGAERFELPAIDVGNLKNEHATWLENPRHFCQDTAWSGHVLHHVKQGYDIQRRG